MIPVIIFLLRVMRR